MSDLFGRRAALQMGIIKVTNLRIAFSITQSSQSDPDTSEINVWNLSEDTRGLIQNQTAVPVVLEVGYGEDIEQIFTGDVRPDGVYSVKDGSDWITTFKAADGLEAWRAARIQKSFKAGTKIKDVLKELVDSMGVGTSKAIAKIKAGDITGAFTDFAEGVTLSGSSPKQLERILSSMGYKFVIQEGQLLIVEKDGVILEEIPVITPDTGLIGSPVPGKDGFTKFKSLLQPRIKPFRKVRLTATEADYSGDYRIVTVTHIGDTRGPTWYSDCEAKAA